jgi:hypothetical protein
VTDDQAAARPAEGERITIRWPGGPYDFVMEFEGLHETGPAPEPGWAWLHGRIVEPDPGFPRWQTLYARSAGGDWEMKPHGG